MIKIYLVLIICLIPQFKEEEEEEDEEEVTIEAALDTLSAQKIDELEVELTLQ